MINNCSLNNLFVEAKNNDNALKELTEMLILLGKRMCKNIILKYGIFTYSVEDFEDYILFVINYIYNNFSPSKQTFADYATYVMYKRLITKVVNTANSKFSKVESLDDVDDDGNIAYELISDPNEISIPDQISYNEAHLRMSSPKGTNKVLASKVKRVYQMLIRGYNGPEIMKALNLTIGQYHYIKKMIKTDEENVEFKIDLK